MHRLVPLLVLAACGGNPESAPTPTPEPAPAPQNHEGHEAAIGPFTPIEAEGARVFFVAPAAGAEVTSPVALTFGVEGAEIRPAGELVPGTGHHHVIVDGGPIEAGTVVPSDERHIHYGKGQTEATLELSPGKHTLTLQFADGAHRSYGPALAQTIEITVTEAGEPATTGAAAEAPAEAEQAEPAGDATP